MHVLFAYSSADKLPIVDQQFELRVVSPEKWDTLSRYKSIMSEWPCELRYYRVPLDHNEVGLVMKTMTLEQENVEVWATILVTLVINEIEPANVYCCWHNDRIR